MQPQNIHRSRTVDAGTMQNELAAFKDPKLARGLIESIGKLAPEGGATLMEVCGTHTVAIARNGIQPHARKRVPLVGPRLPRVRHVEPRYRRCHCPLAHPERDHSNVRRHDARARLHELAS